VSLFLTSMSVHCFLLNRDSLLFVM
jgi:hypothetical protein